MTNDLEAIHRNAVKHYHALCGKLGLTESEKDAICASYGVDSSVDMDTHDLLDVCAKLQHDLQKRQGQPDMDKMRKRAMAAIGNYMAISGQIANSAIIKGIACRATGHDAFNKIPVERLRNLIYLFNNKTKDAKSVARYTC